MIVVTKTKDEIRLEGHANYAPEGQDIVCAGVSALVQTLIQSIQELTQDTIEYSMSPGRVHIKFWNLSSESRTLVGSFFIGCEGIAAAHPNHVKVITS